MESFSISVPLLEPHGISELLIVPVDRYYEIFHHNLLFCTLRKIKGDLWCQLDGDLKQAVIDYIGEAIDESLLQTA